MTFGETEKCTHLPCSCTIVFNAPNVHTAPIVLTAHPVTVKCTGIRLKTGHNCQVQNGHKHYVQSAVEGHTNCVHFVKWAQPCTCCLQLLDLMRIVEIGEGCVHVSG